jgi:hypothetical protein
VELPGAKQLSLDAVIKNGLTLTVGCSEACDVAGELLIGKSQAKALGIAAERLIVIGSGKAALGAAGKKKMKIKLNAKAKRKLRVSSFRDLVHLAKKRRIKLTLRTTTRYGSGKKTTSKRKITLHG